VKDRRTGFFSKDCAHEDFLDGLSSVLSGLVAQGPPCPPGQRRRKRGARNGLRVLWGRLQPRHRLPCADHLSGRWLDLARGGNWWVRNVDRVLARPRIRHIHRERHTWHSDKLVATCSLTVTW